MSLAPLISSEIIAQPKMAGIRGFAG